MISQEGTMNEKGKRNGLKLVICIVVCLAVGGIGTIFTMGSIPTWYAGLAKVSWTPPNWVFAPIWTVLYLLMATAAWLLWRHGTARADIRFALITFLVQLILNFAWTPVFFGWHGVLSGLIIIVALWIVILITILRFWKISRLAGSLLIPYLCWITVATSLNAGVLVLNPG
jgi:translocator protein